MTSECILNLGPFNDCVDSVNNVNDRCCYAVYRVSEETVKVPMTILGLAADKNTPRNRAELKRLIEFKVISMIFEISNKMNREIRLERIRIPIASVDFKDDSNGRLCCTALLGVALFNHESQLI